MPITATPDHVAVAVRDIEQASARWIDELHGVWLTGPWQGGAFVARQIRYGNTGKLELLQPGDVDGDFVTGFLDRFGPRIHHLTLKVPDLAEALGTLQAGGFGPVDVSYARDEWHEAFLRPSEIGGIIVQVARSAHSDEGWAELSGMALPEPAPTAPALLGPTLTHPDLDQARRTWTLLGAEIDDEDDAFTARWPGGRIDVRVEAGYVPGPRGLRFSPDPQLPAHDVAGPGTLPA